MPDLNAASVEAAMLWLKVLLAAWVLRSKTNPLLDMHCFVGGCGCSSEHATLIRGRFNPLKPQ